MVTCFKKQNAGSAGEAGTLPNCSLLVLEREIDEGLLGVQEVVRQLVQVEPAAPRVRHVRDGRDVHHLERLSPAVSGLAVQQPLTHAAPGLELVEAQLLLGEAVHGRVQRLVGEPQDRTGHRPAVGPLVAGALLTEHEPDLAPALVLAQDHGLEGHDRHDIGQLLEETHAVRLLNFVQQVDELPLFGFGQTTGDTGHVNHPLKKSADVFLDK